MKTICIALSLALLIGCGSKKAPDEKAFEASMDSLNNQAPKINDEVVTALLDQIPSPLEISMMLKQSGSKYNSSILNSPDNLAKYNSNYKKALNMGIYGADLGYTNIYGQNMDGVRYLSTIKSLADDLNLGQFFDIATIAKLATNSDNLDSLLLVTTQNFNAINHYLQTENRSNLSILLLVGGWIEAMEIMCQVAESQNFKNKEIVDRIGEQKIILEQIAILLSLYKSDNSTAELIKDFEELNKIFEAVNITYTYKESTMKIVNGVAMIEDNSTTTITITDKDAMAIKGKIDSMRNKIIN